VSPREDKVNVPLTGKGNVNDERLVHQAYESVEKTAEKLGGLARNQLDRQRQGRMVLVSAPTKSGIGNARLRFRAAFAFATFALLPEDCGKHSNAAKRSPDQCLRENMGQCW